MQEYTFTDLVLLIGTNPLPNFVVADYFLEHNPKLEMIWLIHSEENKSRNQKGTEELAKNLENLLKQRCKNRPIIVKLVPLSDISRAKEIQSVIKTKCLEKLDAESSVHFNYTGGTKVMGIHTYRAIEQYAGLKAKTFSYLDAKTFQIIDDEQGAITDDLRQEIKKMAFKEMIDLHHYQRVSISEEESFHQAITVFTNIISNQQLDEYFDREHGYNRVRFENKNKAGSLAEKTSQLKTDELQKITPNPVFQSVCDALPEGLSFCRDGTFSIAGITNAICERVIKFLDGGWLEEYVYAILHHGLNSNHHTVERNWEIRSKNWGGDNKFELDVLVIHGYQLIGISCTTSRNKKLCKSKGFEIILRTRQIGGDEAKAILITCLSESDQYVLEQELQLDTGGGENIIVLGNNALEEQVLLDKVREFMKN